MLCTITSFLQLTVEKSSQHFQYGLLGKVGNVATLQMLMYFDVTPNTYRKGKLTTPFKRCISPTLPLSIKTGHNILNSTHLVQMLFLRTHFVLTQLQLRCRHIKYIIVMKCIRLHRWRHIHCPTKAL